MIKVALGSPQPESRGVSVSTALRQVTRLSRSKTLSTRISVTVLTRGLYTAFCKLCRILFLLQKPDYLLRPVRGDSLSNGE